MNPIDPKLTIAVLALLVVGLGYVKFRLNRRKFILNQIKQVEEAKQAESQAIKVKPVEAVKVEEKPQDPVQEEVKPVEKPKRKYVRKSVKKESNKK